MKTLSKKFFIAWCLLFLARSAPAQTPHRVDPFLDTLQFRTMQWFLDVTPRGTGLTPDRWPTPSPSSIAAVGFALTIYPIAVERKVIKRNEAVALTLKTLRHLWISRQDARADAVSGYKGFFYHFIDTKTGLRAWNCELSTIDTGILIAGILFAQSYFDRNNPQEKEIRAIADSLFRRVDWQWAMNGREGIVM